MEADDLAKVESLLAAHEGALRRLPEARRLRKDARARLQARGDAALASLLAQAEADLAAGEVESAADRLLEADCADRDSGLVQRCESLRRQVEGIRREKHARARFQALLSGRDPLAARDWAADQEGEGWPERQAEAQRALRSAWRLTVLDGPFSDETLNEFTFTLHSFETSFWLREGGEEALLVETWERWLTLYRVRIADGRLLQRVVLRTPVPVKQPDLQAIGGEVWLWADRWLLVLSIDPWDIRTWRDLRPLAPAPEGNRWLRVPGTPYAWTWAAGRKGRKGAVGRVIDVREWKTEQQLGPCDGAAPILGGDHPLVARFFAPDECHIHTARGANRWPFGSVKELPPHNAALSPSGASVLLMSSPIGKPNEIFQELLVAPIPLTGGSQDRPITLPDSNVKEPSAIVTLPKEGVSYVARHRTDGDCDLLQLAPWLQSVELRGGERFHANWRLVQSSDGQAAALIGYNFRRLLFRRLGADLPPFSEEWFGKPTTYPPLFSLPWEMDVTLRARSRVQEMISAPDRSAWLAAREEEILASPERIVDCAVAMLAFQEDELARRFLERAWKRHPTDPWVALSLAMRRADDRRWPEVRELLVTASLHLLPPNTRKRAVHLLGLASLGMGRLREAQEAWRIYDAAPDPELQKLVEYAEELANVPADTPREGILILHLQAIRESDRLLEAGDALGAAAAMTDPRLWTWWEMQTAARRAAAWLEVEPTTLEEWYWKLASLSRLALCRHEKNPRAIDHLLLGEETWEEDLLQALQEAAEAWLADPPGLAEQS